MFRPMNHVSSAGSHITPPLGIAILDFPFHNRRMDCSTGSILGWSSFLHSTCLKFAWPTAPLDISSSEIPVLSGFMCENSGTLKQSKVASGCHYFHQTSGRWLVENSLSATSSRHYTYLVIKFGWTKALAVRLCLYLMGDIVMSSLS